MKLPAGLLATDTHKIADLALVGAKRLIAQIFEFSQVINQAAYLGAGL